MDEKVLKNLALWLDLRPLLSSSAAAAVVVVVFKIEVYY